MGRMLSGFLALARTAAVVMFAIAFVVAASWLKTSSAPETSLVPARDAALAGAGGSLTPAGRLSAAGQVLTGAMNSGGAGFSFFAIQRTTEYAKTGGQQINVVDPADGRTVLGTTSQLFVGAMMSQGFVSPAGYFMDMRVGDSKSTTASFATAPKAFAVIVRGAKTWRDDGAGWYTTSESPGMGIDPTSLRSLPGALTKVSALRTVGSSLLGSITTTQFSATAAIADYPGAVAADGKDFTEATFPVRAWLDGQNRVVQLVITAKNLNQTTWDLVSETTITFDYGPPGALPQPAPTMAPEPSPSDNATSSN